MSVTSENVFFEGGLDEASALTAPLPGRLIGGENIEVVFGEPGYSTISGYERSDGRPAPSAATYTVLVFEAGTAAFSAGETVATDTGSARVLRVAGTVEAGELVLTALVGGFTKGQVLRVAGLARAGVAATSLGDVSDEHWAGDMALARQHYRALITPVPGEGPVLGVAIFAGDDYALRNAVGGATATLWRSSPAGWVAVRAGLRPGGTLRARVANFTGSGATRALYGCDGKNRYWQWTGTGFTFGPAVYGSEGTSASALTPGLGTKVLAIAEGGKSWTVGQQVLVYSATDAGRFMQGTVTAWAAPNLTVNVAAFAGAAASDWHLCLADGRDRPFDLVAHRAHLMLAYPFGQLQMSNVGDPMQFTTTSFLFGVGDDIRSLATLRGEILAIAQTGRINLLYGTDADSWELRLQSETTGTHAFSMQEVGGNGLFVSDHGIMTLDGSVAFGDFDSGDLSRDVKKTFRRLMRDYQCTSLVKGASQFRLYGHDKQVLVMTATSVSGQFVPGKVAFTPLRYLHQPVCSAFATVNGEDRVIFGTDDGWVMRERSGTNFDGAPIASFLRLSYWHHRQPQRRKRWRKLTMDTVGIEPTLISMRQDFDLGGDRYAPGVVYEGGVTPGGGLFDVDDWNTFYWSEAEASQIEVEVDGVGCNMSVTLWTEGDHERVRFVGMNLIYSPVGAQR